MWCLNLTAIRRVCQEQVCLGVCAVCTSSVSSETNFKDRYLNVIIMINFVLKLYGLHPVKKALKGQNSNKKKRKKFKFFI